VIRNDASGRVMDAGQPGTVVTNRGDSVDENGRSGRKWAGAFQFIMGWVDRSASMPGDGAKVRMSRR